jgi:DNA repair exonuclease SbcCD ATPase subunit
MIKLGRMRIENFKSFIEPISFDFTGNDLVLFDGPNGFGKTTIFDAVELCFTGKVSRVKNTDIKAKKDHILKGDNGKPTTVQLELLNGEATLLIIGIYIPANISGAEGKVSHYKNVIKRFETEQWQDVFVNDQLRTSLDVDGLKGLLESEKLDSTFTLFNYIQQEETCHFLKLKEGERHQEISHLFGTSEESSKVTKLDLLSAKLKEKIDTYTPLIYKEKTELAGLSKPSTQENDEKNHVGSGKLSIFSDLSSNTVEQLQAYRSNLEGIDWVLKNNSDYKSLKFNYLLNKITTERITQLDNYLRAGVVKSYDEFRKLDIHYLAWTKANKKADIYNELIQIFEGAPNTLSKDTLNKYNEIFPDNYSAFTTDITSFDHLSKVSSSLSSLLIKIDESRKNLLSHYKKHLGHDESKYHKNIPCPLCGHLKSDWLVLLDEYDAQTKIFSDQLGDNGKLLTAVTKKLIKDLVVPLIAKMKKYINKYDKYINLDLSSLNPNNINKIEETDFESMVKIKDWLALHVGDCSSFIDKTLLEVNQNYSEAREQLITFINSHKKPLVEDAPKAYASFLQDLKTLNLAFDKNVSLAVDSSDIAKDLLLLSRLIVQQNSTSYKVKEKNLAKLIGEVEKLTTKRNEITDISKVFKKEIKAFEKEVAKHIAIPLFVYSSKILQSRPEGSGIFLITPETNNANGFMQFSATPNDSHDAWNTMSSGQLAGVVISFMLAMNKVYPSKLSTLMIDDPVQTMDEVNMASFVQMMRYEFPEMQILLSTHESKVANYFHYKYSEAGLKSQPINMKNRRLEYVE